MNRALELLEDATLQVRESAVDSRFDLVLGEIRLEAFDLLFRDVGRVFEIDGEGLDTFTVSAVKELFLDPWAANRCEREDHAPATVKNSAPHLDPHGAGRRLVEPGKIPIWAGERLRVLLARADECH